MRYELRAIGVYDNDAGVLIRPRSSGWAEYIAWIAEGNAPDPAPLPVGPTTAQVRAEQLALVNIVRADQLARPVTFNGHDYDADPVSKGNVVATVAAVSVGVPLPDGFTWRTSDNVDVPMTSTDLVGLAGTMLARGNAIYAWSWTLKAAIEAADDPSTVDINAGWPA